MIFKILKDLGYEIDDSIQKYYGHIRDWNDWWQGFVKKHHQYEITLMDRSTRIQKRHTLKMAKKVSEDWASLLLNDKTYINCDDEKSQEFLSGNKTEQNTGVLGLSKFWKYGNRCIEKEFALGTACFYLDLVNPKYNGKKISADNVRIKYIKDASMIIPLSSEQDEITSLALASPLMKNGKRYKYIQIFEPEKTGYRIYNHYYEIKNEGYEKVDNLDGVVQDYYLPCKPFFILRPNLENNIDDVELGMSIYANAIDQLLSCDISFDNFFMDGILGKKKLFINQSAISSTDKTITVKDPITGNDVQQVVKVPLVADAIEQSLYVDLGEKMPDEQQIFNEYNPDLRVQQNKEAIQMNLNLLSAKVGLGQYRYQFDERSMKTATEVKVSNKDLTESIWKQRIEIQDVLVEMTRSILILGKEICNIDLDVNTNISIQFDNSMFTNEEAERIQDLSDVNAGIMAKWEYRMKYYGEDEETAKKKVEEIKTERSDKEELGSVYA